MSSENLIISTNSAPEQTAFVELLDHSLRNLTERYEKTRDIFETGNDKFFEGVVFDAMNEVAENTPFKGTIELISGHNFPDIVANNLFGVEVKSVKSKKWTTTGNSILEGVSSKGLERIYIMFGQLISPCEFRFRNYEECLASIAVTHSPRYKVDMDLKEHETIFSKMGISYKDFKELDSPIAHFINFYRSINPNSESLWWVGPAGEEKTVDFEIKQWSKLTRQEKTKLVATTMLNFPEVFGVSQDKFEKVAVFLMREKGVVCSALRDNFSAGGKVTLRLDTTYEGIPQIFKRLKKVLPLIFHELIESENGLSLSEWLNEIKPHIEAQPDIPPSFFTDLQNFINEKYQSFLKNA